MAILSISLLRNELDKWLKLKKAIDKTPDGRIHDFGAMMNSTYNLNNQALHNEKDHNMALLIMMSKHVKEETKI
jgi:hypothetical protein|tara:strand:- start:752 stop:973 length:222 start_codon:yes stop_codon:yes gene_type:complete